MMMGCRGTLGGTFSISFFLRLSLRGERMAEISKLKIQLVCSSVAASKISSDLSPCHII